jgi:hypothetical protein
MNDSGEPLWTAKRGLNTIRATLVNRNALGWEIVLYVDAQPWCGARQQTRAAAIVEADTYRRALEESGWRSVQSDSGSSRRHTALPDRLPSH